LPTFEFLHAADLHLDSPLRGLDADAPAERIRNATREALRNLVKLALERQVAFVLLAGDLYDGDWKDWRTGHFLIEQLSQLERARIKLVAISGNHDAGEVLTKSLPFPGTMLSSKRPETVEIEHLGVAIHGQSFATRSVTDNLARHYPEPMKGAFNIGLLHTACGNSEHLNYAPCTEAELAEKGYDYWALGHVHTRSDREIGNTRIVFPGNIQGRHIREEGAKGAAIVTVESRRIAEVRHHSLDVLRWKHLRIDVTGAADMDTILNRTRPLLDQELMLAEDRLLAVRITLTGACPAHASLARSTDEVRQKMRGLASELAGLDLLWIEDVRLNTVPALDRAALSSQPGAAGALIAALQDEPKFDQSLAEFVKQLVAYPDALEEDHPARAIIDGRPVPDQLIERARALLLSELVRG
jgi:DNA repair exonuclease SbcCD nuclease subunit